MFFMDGRNTIYPMDTETENSLYPGENNAAPTNLELFRVKPLMMNNRSSGNENESTIHDSSISSTSSDLFHKDID